ncbi:MAG: precorrin-2 dehydrogenase/sirohydrochlorin ferrochelatase family protein, partial [Acidimicrobiales bacterium]
MTQPPDDRPSKPCPPGAGSGPAASAAASGSASGSAGAFATPEPPASPDPPDLPPGAIFPVGLVLGGRRCLVVGGGRVAARKAAGLLQCGATVTVVAPEVHDSLRLLAR